VEGFARDLLGFRGRRRALLGERKQIRHSIECTHIACEHFVTASEIPFSSLVTILRRLFFLMLTFSNNIRSTIEAREGLPLGRLQDCPTALF
jgi:hypothetical protein